MTDTPDLVTLIERFFPHPSIVPSDWTFAHEYAVTLYEPLLSDTQRTEVVEEMRKQCQRSPVWACIWFAGITHTIMSTLPNADPWRHKHPLRMPSLMQQYARSVKGEDEMPFGTYQDVLDLAPQWNPHTVSMNWRLAMFTEPLGNDAAQALAAAGDSVRECAYVLASQCSGHGDMVFSVGNDMLRWVIARRRMYEGNEDEFPMWAIMQWGWRAARLVKRTTLGHDMFDLEIAEDEFIPEEAYSIISEG